MATTPVKNHFTYTTKDIYQRWVKQEKAKGVPLDKILGYKPYKKLMEDFFIAVVKKVIYENFTFTMPHKLGQIRIKAFRYNPKSLQIDFHNTKKHKMVIKFLNRHTFGYTYRRWWEKEHVGFKNKSVYHFTGAQGKYPDDRGVGKKAIGEHIKRLSETPEIRSYINL